jgi:integration host factor subunit beta
VPAKNVVTFKPGKEMEELVRNMDSEKLRLLDDARDADEEQDGPTKLSDSARENAPEPVDSAE